jgi:4'-phosphopantetheinyl transferase
MLREQLYKDVHIWTMIPEAERDPARLARFRAMLSADELDRLRRFRVEPAAHRYLVSHALLRTVLSRYAEIDPARWRFVYGSHGRPEIANSAAPPLRFNLTHTDGLTACIVSLNQACGIDAERLSGRHNPTGVARKMFSTREYEQLRQLSGRACLEYFYERWTLREAYVKALGVGLAFPTRKVDFTVHTDESIGVVFAPGVQDHSRHWHFRLHRPTTEHVVAVALRHYGESEPGVVLHNFDFDG